MQDAPREAEGAWSVQGVDFCLVHCDGGQFWADIPPAAGGSLMAGGFLPLWCEWCQRAGPIEENDDRPGR